MYLSLPPRPSWQAQAACLGVGPDLFFPERGASGRDTAPAKAICASCPVEIPCREAGMAEKHGIWGGTVVDDRRAMRKISA